MTAPLVLSIQSRVAFGHVGNSAAAFLLQRSGFEVVELPTVLLSAHPGHGRPGGGAISAEVLASMLDGLDRIGVLERVAGVIVGYLGTPANGAVAAEAIRRVKAVHPAAPVLVDPVIGDRDGGAYVADGILECFRDRLIPLADIVKPNHFELEALAGRPLPSTAEALAALDALGPGLAVVTSFEAGDGLLTTLLRMGGRTQVARTWPVAEPPHGLGDSLGALLMAGLLSGLAPAAALGRALGVVEALIAEAARLGLDELPLIEAQHLIESAPPVVLEPVSSS